MLFQIITVSSFAAVALAAVHDVDVGENGNVFNPTSITAAVGDTVNFHFYPGAHSVAQSTFDAPCTPSGPNAIFSGFFTPSNGQASTMFQMVVNSTDPIWLYCSQGDHCQDGMVLAINPTSSQTEDMYLDASTKASSNTSPETVGGGVVIANKEGAVAAGASSAAASSAASSTPASSAAASSAASSAAASSSAASSSAASSAAAMSSSASSAPASSHASSMAATSAPAATTAPKASSATSAAVQTSTGAAAPTNMAYPMAMAGAAVAAVAGVLL